MANSCGFELMKFLIRPFDKIFLHAKLFSLHRQMTIIVIYSVICNFRLALIHKNIPHTNTIQTIQNNRNCIHFEFKTSQMCSVIYDISKICVRRRVCSFFSSLLSLLLLLLNHRRVYKMLKNNFKLAHIYTYVISIRVCVCV